MKLKMKKLLFISLAAVIGISALYNGAFFAFKPKNVSAASENSLFSATELSIGNPQFGDSASSSFPNEPAQWTGEALNGSSTAKMYNGVVSMDPDVYNFNGVLETYHLGDGVTPPANPFSEPGIFPRAAAADSGYYGLMINTREASAAYAYTSASFTLEANTCYEISAYVLTLDFKESGAGIKLVDAETNLSIGRKADPRKNITEKLMAFRSIDTSKYNPDPKEPALKNWRKYTFNIQTSFTSLNVKLSLSVGGDGREGGVNTKGIAFFDNITGETISRQTFERNTAKTASDFLFYSFENEQADRGMIDDKNTSYIKNGDFTTNGDYKTKDPAGNKGLYAWEKIDYTNRGSVDYGRKNFSGKAEQLNADNQGVPRIADLKQDNAYTPFTKAGDYNNTALRITHPENDAADKGASATGVISSSFTLQRFRYYRISVWFLTLDGAQANIQLSMPDDSVNAEAPRKTLSSMTALSSAENVNTENWQQASFYVKGSSVKDFGGVCLELWLGYGDRDAKSTHSTGTVYFDKIEIQYLDTAEYGKYSGSGTAVTLDSFVALSTITNGDFNEIEYADFDSFEADGSLKTGKTLSPASWAFVNGEDEVLNRNSVLFDYNDTAVTRGVIPAGPDIKSHTVLQIHNGEASAAGYSSSDISLSSGSYQKISVRIKTDDGAKAFLQLTESGNPIAVLENITTKNKQWTEYAFIVWTGDSASLKLTLWNGWYSEKEYEPYKNLSQGTVYFASAYSESSSKDDYDKKSDGSDKTVKTVDMNSHFGLFDNSAGALKVPYRYTLSGTRAPEGAFNGGVLDTKNVTAQDAEEIFTPREDEGAFVLSNPGTSSDSLRYVLMANNRVLSAFKYTSVKSVSLSSSSYYKISVSVRTAQLCGEAGSSSYGAYIGLSGIKDAAIRGIKSDDKYTTYTFYIATGDEGFTFNYELGLGDVKSAATYTKGFAFFEDMSYEAIDKVKYDNAAATDTARKLTFITSAAATPENDVGKSFWDWYWLPTLLFGLALLFVLIALGVRKLVPALAAAIATRKRNKSAASYDRGADEPKRKAPVTRDDEYIDVVETVKAKPAPDKQGGEKTPGGAYDDYFED